MCKRLLAALATCFWAAAATLAADAYRVEKYEDGPPADVLSPEVVAALSPTGYKVVDAKGKTVAEVWLAKELALTPDFQPTLEILYPLASGSLVGALTFPQKGADFRGQDIPRGSYTLRYGNQPQDGNHVGTFETRDFLLMLPAAADRNPKTLEGEDFFATSAEAAESTHPAILPLLRPEEGDAPALHHIEEFEWWVLRLAGQAKGGQQVIEPVIIGKAQE